MVKNWQLKQEINMSKFMALCALVFSMGVSAHVKPGNYSGVAQDGKACSFSVGLGFFENNTPHPLNEREPVSQIVFADHSDSEQWNLGHPPVVSVEEGKVRFNHDIFQAIKVTKVGANSITLYKDEEESEEGHAPIGITYVIDNYRDASQSKKLTCIVSK
jgi:hypothetical protein